MARLAKLIWTEPALDDLDDIAAFIALENPVAAAEPVTRVMGAIERLRRFPDPGRFVPEAPGRIYREVIVPPIRIIYRRVERDVLLVYVMRSEQHLRPSRLR